MSLMTKYERFGFRKGEELVKRETVKFNDQEFICNFAMFCQPQEHPFNVQHCKHSMRHRKIRWDCSRQRCGMFHLSRYKEEGWDEKLGFCIPIEEEYETKAKD